MNKNVMSQSFTCSVSHRTLTIETGKFALLANGAVTVRYGDTMVLVTVCVSKEPLGKVDFLPLTVNYEERLYAAGKIPGSFIRREGRPSEEAVLNSRFIDRALRPLIPKEFTHEVQITITTLSADKENDPGICALIGASAALGISKIPFSGPVSAVQVAYIDNDLSLNPTLAQAENSLLSLVVASTENAVVMVEGAAKEAPEHQIMEAIKFAHNANQEIIGLQKELAGIYGTSKMIVEPRVFPVELSSCIAAAFEDKLDQFLGQKEKQQREQALSELKANVKQELSDSFPEEDIRAAFDAQLKSGIRSKILRDRHHLDGRQPHEVRPLACEVGILPRTHGSGMFTRGKTQVLTITTLGSLNKEQLLDGLGLEETKRFMHHYNFPRFSVGEVGRVGSPGRREIGHGALVERAIAPILPPAEDFPYAIRLVSEVLSSNGSSSMASTCGSTLSLMDAGVPIKAPVAGIAMGLITDADNNYVILTDIEGMEDACGDMDFKVAGTAQGITALQLDIKLKGINYAILEEALERARLTRLEILDKMRQTISASRPELNQYAPRMYEITISQDKIGAVIGPGGKTIRSIIDETKTTIDIKDDGTIIIGSNDEAASQKAIEIIESITKEAKIGDVYTGRVTRVFNFGAMVEILRGKEGLVHISELANYHVDKVEDIAEVGKELTVKVIEIDHTGRINLSCKAVNKENHQTGRDSQAKASPPSNRRDQRPQRPYKAR